MPWIMQCALRMCQVNALRDASQLLARVLHLYGASSPQGPVILTYKFFASRPTHLIGPPRVRLTLQMTVQQLGLAFGVYMLYIWTAISKCAIN